VELGAVSKVFHATPRQERCSPGDPKLPELNGKPRGPPDWCLQVGKEAIDARRISRQPQGASVLVWLRQQACVNCPSVYGLYVCTYVHTGSCKLPLLVEFCSALFEYFDR
jgi:hypothetical protein